MKKYSKHLKVSILLFSVVFLFFIFKISLNNNTQEYISKDLGFSFMHSKNFYILSDIPPAERIFVIATSSLRLSPDTNSSAVVISLSDQNPSTSALDWLKSENSGYDITKGYTEFLVDGQKAFKTTNSYWVIFESPDNKKLVSITILNPKETTVEEFNLIIKSFKFND